MNVTDAVAEVVADLDAGGQRAWDAVWRGLSLAVGVWTCCADTDPADGWDLFGLDVCAAAEALHLSLVPTPAAVEWPVVDGPSTRRAMVTLVEALAVSVQAAAADPGQPVGWQLAAHAAAAQLRRGGGALR